jgi:very-short-patch-repair endonuclease
MDPTHPYRGIDPSRDHELARLAAAQHGVVATRQLLAIGYSRRQAERLADKRLLHRLYRGVYAVGHTCLTARGRWMAAVLACGVEAVLSHLAGAALWEISSKPSGAIDVTAPWMHRLTRVRCHVARRLDPADQTTLDGIPVTSLNRTLLDLAELLHPQRLRSTLEAAQRRDLLNAAQLHAYLDASPGRHGLKPLRAALTTLADHAPWTQSRFETYFLEIVRQAGLPEPRVNVPVADELVDCYWPDQGLIVELDSWGAHKTKAKFNADRRRDVKLQISGHRVARFTYEQVVEQPRAAIRDLRLLLNPEAGGR